MLRAQQRLFAFRNRIQTLLLTSPDLRSLATDTRGWQIARAASKTGSIVKRDTIMKVKNASKVKIVNKMTKTTTAACVNARFQLQSDTQSDWSTKAGQRRHALPVQACIAWRKKRENRYGKGEGKRKWF
jgi:hypothetical protein